MLTYLHTLCRDLPPEDEDAGLELMVVVKVGGRGGGHKGDVETQSGHEKVGGGGEGETQGGRRGRGEG